MKELKKLECIIIMITITPILKIEINKWGALGILKIIDNSVYICTCNVI